MIDWGWDLGEPEQPEPCQYCSVMKGVLVEHEGTCDGLTKEQWIELNARDEKPCLAVVRDAERMTTYCARPEGHAGEHLETIMTTNPYRSQA